MKLISFVIPCYRSEKTIKKVTDEIIETVSEKTDTDEYDYEIICINDFSPDNVYSVLKKLASENEKIKVINLAKNMGKHAAVMAGYSVADGDYIVNLDDDYQCPVNELWRLIEPLKKGVCDFTTASYSKKKQSAFKNFGSNVNLTMSKIMLDKPSDMRLENFSAMKRFVMDEMLRYKHPYPYLEGLILRVTKSITLVPMEQRNRADDNETGFTLKKSLSLWLNGLTAFSVKPLRIATILGFLFSISGFIFMLYMVINKILNPAVPLGYTSTISIFLFIGGIIMLMLGLIGEYIGRIYICINESPQYVIKETINVDGEKGDNI